MIIVKHKAELNSLLERERLNGLQIGFVPTMGALHQGHLSLLQQSIEENDKTVCSIFVNPTQFNNPEDLTKYPRQLEQDIKMLESIHCDYLFAPHTEEMYSDNEQSINFDFGKLEQVMEGANRPGHFQGVATIVKKLFEAVKPDKAYFGKKDYQQLMIIKSLQQQYQLSPKIVACEIVREADGLAMSSRNQRLSPQQRKEAPQIYQTLLQAKKLCKSLSVNQLKDWITKQINANPLMSLEYFEIANSENLQSIDDWNYSKSVMGFIVVNMNDIRLIDNINLCTD